MADKKKLDETTARRKKAEGKRSVTGAAFRTGELPQKRSQRLREIREGKR